jgi:NitT/TauT family transport system ATP-binding protein
MNSEAIIHHPAPNAHQLLRLQDVCFSYSDGNDAVIHINLNLSAGEFRCLIGRSGCGKTSLLKLAAGLLTPKSGQVIWQNINLEAPQAEMGFVFQRPTLLEWLDVLDNVLLPIRLHRKVELSDIDNAKKLLEKLELGNKTNHKPTELSGGQQSRVAIARALVNRPRILFMDEPFASLDAITREELQKDLLQICKEQHTTILFVTHDIGEAVYLGDQVSVMDHGEIHLHLNIDLPKPRQNPIRHSPEFNSLCAKLRQSLEVLP